MKNGTKVRPIQTEAEVNEATTRVKKYIPNFDYASLLTELRQPGTLKSRFESTNVGYEKVQLFRHVGA